MDLLWFNFIPGLILCLRLITTHYYTLKQRKIIFTPEINTYIRTYLIEQSSTCQELSFKKIPAKFIFCVDLQSIKDFFVTGEMQQKFYFLCFVEMKIRPSEHTF